MSTQKTGFLWSEYLISLIGFHGVMLVAYRVEYGRETKNARKRRFRVIPMTIIAWICFILLVNSRWPKGQALLSQYLLPESVETAIETLLAELKSGEAFLDAAGDFCREVMALGEYSAD